MLPEFGSSGVPSGSDLTSGMRRLDALVQLSAIAFATTPPADPSLGDRYIVQAPATGAFASHELHLAAYEQSGWAFYVPRDGWLANVAGELWAFDETTATWSQASAGGGVLIAKGDIMVFDGTDIQRLPVGSDDTQLIADSAEPLGVRWDVPSVGDIDVNICAFYAGTPASNALILAYTSPDFRVLRGNFSGSYGHVGTDPSGSTVFDVAVNGSGVGTITIGTDGAFTFATTGGATVDLSAGDRLTVTAPASLNGLADISFTFVADPPSGGLPTKFTLSFFVPGTPGSEQLIAKATLTRALYFQSNFSGSYGDIGTNPTSSFVMNVSVNGAFVGTITVSTGGAFTFSTAMPQIDMLPGDTVEIEAPSSVDATAADISLSLLALFS